MTAAVVCAIPSAGDHRPRSGAAGAAPEGVSAQIQSLPPPYLERQPVRLHRRGTARHNTTFLDAIDTPPCLNGSCDWRLPTRTELQTILLSETYPCTTNPGLDVAVFGPIGPLALGTWTSTTYAVDPGVAFGVDMGGGGVFTATKDAALPVRAVRGGL